jgi:SAM-dependent methyltransferase
MAHPQQHFFVGGIKQFLPEYFAGKRVLEIGSLNINGSVRAFFTDCTYIGLDLGEGKDVDVICAGEDYGDKAGSFDVIISCEAMEHNPQWRKTWLNMMRLVKPDGLVVMTCATTGRKQHGTNQYNPTESPMTQDYYRNLTSEDFSAVLPCDAWFSMWYFGVDHTNHDLYFFGLASDAPAPLLERARQLRSAFEEHYFKLNTLGLQ